MLLLLLGVLQRYWAMLSFRMLYLYLEGYRLVSGRTITMDTYVDAFYTFYTHSGKRSSIVLVLRSFNFETKLIILGEFLPSVDDQKP